ncbi:MAG: hypothetical protein ACK5XN_32370 [Bacteroidota bacterium]
MKTLGRINKLIEKLKPLGIKNPFYDGSISYGNLNTDIHFFNSFNETIVAIESLSPKILSKKNKVILLTLFNERNNIDLPLVIKNTTTIEDFKTQLKIPFIIIDNPSFKIRISIFDDIRGQKLSGGILKLLAVHSKQYNLKPKKNNSFFKQEQTVFEIITSIIICREYGKWSRDNRGNTYLWNGYNLGTEYFMNSDIENIKTFYPK